MRFTSYNQRCVSRAGHRFAVSSRLHDVVANERALRGKLLLERVVPLPRYIERWMTWRCNDQGVVGSHAVAVLECATAFQRKEVAA